MWLKSITKNILLHYKQVVYLLAKLTIKWRIPSKILKIKKTQKLKLLCHLNTIILWEKLIVWKVLAKWVQYKHKGNQFN